MSLRNDQKSQRNVSRAARRHPALRRACESVVGRDARPWESLETRTMMSLVHQYPFNEGTADPASTTTVDSVAGKNGTLYSSGNVGLAANPGDPGVSWGILNPSPAGGSYLHFDSSFGTSADGPFFNNNGGRVDLSPDNTLAQSLARDLGFYASLTAWVRITQPNPAEPIGNDTTWRAPAITGNEHAGAGNDIFFGTVATNAGMGVQKSDGATARSAPLDDGAWHLLAFSRDYDTGQAKVYVDGRLVSTATSSAGPVSSFFDAIGALTLVAGDQTTIQGYNYLNNTDLDDVRMYNHVLSQGEVNALQPGTATGALAAVTPVSVTADPASFRNLVVSFTDTNTNELGFVLERANAFNGQPVGNFAQVALLAAGSALSYTDRTLIGQGEYLYRIRPFNLSGDGPNAVTAQATPSAANMGNGAIIAGLNSNFWGANNRQWPADPDPTDGFTSNGANNQAQDVGTIRLTGDTATPHDPANPAGIAVRNADALILDPLTAGTPANTLSRTWAGNGPGGGIRTDNFTTFTSGKITITADFDGDGVEGGAVKVRFIANGDNDIHAYVNNVLVSTDPNTGGARDSTNNVSFLDLREGQSYDFAILQAEQGGDASMGLKWALVTVDTEGVVSVGSAAFIPTAQVTPLASRPQASTLVPQDGTGAGTDAAPFVSNSHRQASFNITDTTTSEQRFELWRKLPTDPDTAYAKVNEAGVNSPFINDASALPGQTYDYILVGVNNASGYTLPADAIAKKVRVTMAAAPAVTQGLNKFSFNDDFYATGEARPLPRLGNYFVGAGTFNVGGADTFQLGVKPDEAYGDDNHTPSTGPTDFKGSPNTLIRDNSHSTVWTGKIIAPTDGSYQILLYSDDDGLVIVDNVITSADLAGHGARDPRVSPNANDRFSNPITLTAGPHDIVLFHSEQGGGSAVQLRWVLPGGDAANPVVVPIENLSTDTSAPVAQGAPTASDLRGNSALITAGANNATNELKNVLVVASDAAFTQNVQRLAFGPLVTTAGAGGAANNPQSVRVTGLQPNTDYFVKMVTMNLDGQVESAVTQFNSGGAALPAAPTNLVVRPQTATQSIITFTDNSFDETGFIIQRRKVGEATFANVATVGPNTTTFTDQVDPVAFPAGTQFEYQVVATNAAGNSASPAARQITLGGPGGTGLRRRIWGVTDTNPNPDEVYNNTTRIGEPARNTDGSAQAPYVDDVDPIIPNNWGTGVPDFNSLDFDQFAIEWVGEIQAEETKAYDFSIISDDGSRLFINDVEVIDGHWLDQGDSEAFSGPISLTAGQRVKVRFQQYDQGGGSSARLRWNGANANAREDIPAVFMFPTVTANDEVAAVPVRPVTQTEVFAVPQSDPSSAGNIAIRWEDNAFGERGYDVQRADDAAFTQGVKMVSQNVDDSDGDPNTPPVITENVGPGRELLIDNGGLDPATQSPTPLDPTKTYFYRVRPRGAGDAAWVNAGSAKPFGVGETDPNTGLPQTINIDQAGTDLTIANFPTPEMLTLNGRASVTGEQSLKLTHNINDRSSSAFVNRSFDVDTDFKVNYDFRIGDSNGADGMTFVIQNSRVTRANTNPTPLRSLGGGGGAMGYNGGTGFSQSVAVEFDFHDALDTMGVWVNGAVPPGGVIANYGAANRANTAANQPHPTNSSIDLRNTANLTTGTAAINIDGGTRFRLLVDYKEHGFDADGNGTPGDPGDTGLLTVSLATAAAPNTILVTAQYMVDLATVLNSETGIMGWTAATGGLNARMEVYNFTYDGPVSPPVNPVLSEVYVRGASWLGQDNNPATTTFMEYLEAKGLGDDVYGYRLFGNNAPVPGPAGNTDQILPWINVDQVVLKYANPPTGAGIPTAGNVLFTSQKGVTYTITSVTPVVGDPTAFVVTLDKPLGGGNPTTGVAPTTGENGDHITLGVNGAGAGGSNFSLRMNILQGDTDHTGEVGGEHSVLAADFSAVKKKFFKDTTSPTTGTDADYTPFHDVNGSGSILANDFSEVKKRFFQNLAAAAAPAGDMFSVTRVAEEVLK